MIKTLATLGLCACISGCVAVPAAAIYSGSLKGVERVSKLYVADIRPGVDVDAGSACLIAEMPRGQIIRLGSGDSRFVTQAYRTALNDVALRPKAANCLADLGQTAA